MNLTGAKFIFSQPRLCNKYLSCDLYTERQGEGGLKKEGMEGRHESLLSASKKSKNVTELLSNLINVFMC